MKAKKLRVKITAKVSTMQLRVAAGAVTALQLRLMMKKHSLTNAKVAELLGVSVKTVESWLAAPGSASHRNMPARYVRALGTALQVAAERGGRKKQ